MNALAALKDWLRRKAYDNRYRQRRFAAFVKRLVPLPRPVRLLDIGGGVSFWRQMGNSLPLQGLDITILKLQIPASRTAAFASFRATHETCGTLLRETLTSFSRIP